MPWAYEQGNGNHGTGASDTPITVTLGIPTPVGRLVIVGISNFNGVASTVTDSAGNTYTPRVSDAPTQIVADMWYTITTIAGTLTITVSGIGLNYTAVAVDEFSSTQTITTDATSTGDGTNATPITGNVTIAANDLVYGVVSMGNLEGGHTAGSGYTLTYSLASQSGANLGIVAEYKLNVTSSPQTPGFTFSSPPSSSWTMLGASWQAPPDPPPATQQPQFLLPGM